MTKRTLTVRTATYPIAGGFRISRETRTEAKTVIAEISEGGARGRGECTPYARYGETPDSVTAAIEKLRGDIESGLSLEDLQHATPPGAARNAVDCALWDLTAKLNNKSVATLAGLEAPAPAVTAFTLSIDAPGVMAAKAAFVARPLLKLKLAGDGEDAARCAAVAAAAPDAKLILDANEALTIDELDAVLAALPAANIALMEQPLPADEDASLEGYQSPIALCADESLHTRRDLDVIAARYQAVNVKLDKTGGLSEAIATVREARARGLTVMVGCMVASSLAMAPAFLLSPLADYIDLDGPLLLEQDIEGGLKYEGAKMFPPTPALWG